MGLLSNSIDRRELKVGDHIYSYRAFHTYSHHGIYVGNNMVIHYTRTEPKPIHQDQDAEGCEVCGYRPKVELGVVKSCLDCFLINRFHRLFRFDYGVSSVHFFVKNIGTCSLGKCDTPDVVVHRTTRMLVKDNDNIGDFGEYHILDNNCESFAAYCMTGTRSSAQAQSLKTTFKIFLKNITEKPLNLENLVSTVAEMMFGYKIEVLRKHAISEYLSTATTEQG